MGCGFVEKLPIIHCSLKLIHSVIKHRSTSAPLVPGMLLDAESVPLPACSQQLAEAQFQSAFPQLLESHRLVGRSLK